MGANAYDNGTSPFLTERARQRAPHIVSFASVFGSAFLVSPSGAISLYAYTASSVEAEGSIPAEAYWIAQHTRTLADRARADHDAVISFRHDDATCVQAAPIGRGWLLCVVSTVGASPVVIRQRIRAAANVLAMALVDGTGRRHGPSSAGSGGAPAQVALRVKR